MTLDLQTFLLAGGERGCREQDRQLSLLAGRVVGWPGDWMGSGRGSADNIQQQASVHTILTDLANLFLRTANATVSMSQVVLGCQSSHPQAALPACTLQHAVLCNASGMMSGRCSVDGLGETQLAMGPGTPGVSAARSGLRFGGLSLLSISSMLYRASQPQPELFLQQGRKLVFLHHPVCFFHILATLSACSC